MDDFTFNQIGRSERLYRAADGYALPKSHYHVRSLVIKKLVNEELDGIKLNNGRFSITFHESTSARNRTSTATFQGFHSQGLLRIHSSMNTKKHQVSWGSNKLL